MTHTPTLPNGFSRDFSEAPVVTVQDRILGYLAKPWREWTETYVLANSIGFRGQTAKVRRELRKLETAGRVVSKDSWRHHMLEWKLAPGDAVLKELAEEGK